MKKFLLTILLSTSLYTSAQIVITPNPVDINSGIVTITYGSNSDYSLFDPMGNPSLLLYTGLQTDADPATWDYHDDFNDVSSYVTFNFDATANAYVAQVDIASRMYQEEPTLNVVTLPQGTTVNDWYFIIITSDLMRQSADLKASDYGWQAATLSNDVFEENTFQVTPYKDQLFFNKPDFYSIKTYNLQGQLINEFKRGYVDGLLDLSSLDKNTLYVSKISTKDATVIIKHIW